MEKKLPNKRALKRRIGHIKAPTDNILCFFNGSSIVEIRHTKNRMYTIYCLEQGDWLERTSPPVHEVY